MCILLMPRTLLFTVLLLIQQLLQFFHPLSQDVPWVLDVEISNNIYDSPITEHSRLYLAFWSDMLFCINLSPLWCGHVSLIEVKATQTCGHKHKPLDYSLTQWILGPMISQVIIFWSGLQYQAQNLSCGVWGVGFLFNERLSYCHVRATMPLCRYISPGRTVL